jgi:hypothetical protein
MTEFRIALLPEQERTTYRTAELVINGCQRIYLTRTQVYSIMNQAKEVALKLDAETAARCI